MIEITGALAVPPVIKTVPLVVTPVIPLLPTPTAIQENVAPLNLMASFVLQFNAAKVAVSTNAESALPFNKVEF